MNIPKFPKKTNHLKDAIDAATLDLLSTDPGTEDYARKLDQLNKLIKMKEINSPSPVSRDTLVLAATNLAGILAVLHYERIHVVTSKALGFIVKPR